MNRRELLGVAPAAWLATGLAYGSPSVFAAAGAQPLRVGVIGPGSRGKELIRQLLHVPGVEIGAVCDVYEPRFAEVNELVGHSVPAFKDFNELLAFKGLNAIAIASPISFHCEHVLAALRAGFPVYGEKAMAFNPEQCQQVLAEASRPGRMYQVGHQYRYAAWVQEAIKKVHAGSIGEPTHVYAYWHRNNSWRRPVPDVQLDRLINWRLYKETSGGLVTELGSHHIDIANWVFGAQPERVIGTTSIVHFNDGRTVGDNVQVVFNYPGGRRLFFSSLTDNAREGNSLMIYGTEGSIEITIEDSTIFYEPSAHPKPQPAADVVAHGVTTGASYHTEGEMPYRGPGERLAVPTTEDPTLTAVRSFVECVRTGSKPLADAHVGYASGVSAAQANKAANTEEPQKIPMPA